MTTTNLPIYARQAIVTKYHGPGNVRGSRVSAKADAGRVTIEWDHRLNVEENHAAAAHALLKRLGWAGPWAMGSLPGGGYVFVNAIPDTTATVSGGGVQ